MNDQHSREGAMRGFPAWRMHRSGEPLRQEWVALPVLEPDQVLVRVAGCGVCHTDLGFYYDGTPTAKKPPLTLGHEISGFVEDAGREHTAWIGRAVLVPAVIPCGSCPLCQGGHARICPRQVMPGNHVDGGFASHVVVPGRQLCAVGVRDAGEPFGDSGVTLCELSVVADAVTTPYQALLRTKVTAGSLVIVVGAGGVGGFAVQLARARGARVVAADVNPRRLELAAAHGAELTLDAREAEPRALRRAVQEFAASRALPTTGWKILECSGNPAGQALAFGLLVHGATLGIVGYTAQPVALRLANLMAFDATAVGNWGCDPRHYPDVLALVEQGRVRLAPFVCTHPLERINDVFAQAHRGELDRRAVLVPGAAG